MNAWTSFFSKANEDSQYTNYKFITDQISHLYLGFFMSVTYTYFLWKLWGTYPTPLYVSLFVTAMFFMWWEVLYRRWRGLTSIENTILVFAGTAITLKVDFQKSLETVFLWLLYVALLSCVGAVIRIQREYKCRKIPKIE